METVVFIILCLGVHRLAADTLQRQKRNWIIDSFSIDEGYKGPYPYSLGTIKTVKDLIKIHGQGVDMDPKGILQINSETGEITVHGPVDFEKHQKFTLTFQAIDTDLNVDTQLGIEIIILDANDNAPKFNPENYEISVKESTSQGTELVTLKAVDFDSSPNNREFDLRIVSVTPKPQDLEFYLKTPEAEAGTISFKGCLDHEKAEKYTIQVEAKDHGENPLSSSCTVIINVKDGNNHLPEIIGQTGSGSVKEGARNVLVSRLQVTDKDTKGTAAWRAKFHIHGDANRNFRVETDSETNEGLLYVDKPLDYEASPVKTVTVTVENDMPYFTCKVLTRNPGLWKLITSSDSTEALALSTYNLSVTVEDVNDPPLFDKPNQEVVLWENVPAGRYLQTFTATDPDFDSVGTFKYIKGDDPDDWVTVDPATGRITTSKIIDRESPYVKDGVYKVTVLAADNGNPPMTGTATLTIHITDENDNAPSLAESTIHMCHSDGPLMANITALDPDMEPYGGPFHFQLHGDVEDKWKVEPKQGYSVHLVKEHTVLSGHHQLLLEVSDLQGESAVHKLSVSVCDCSDTKKPNCSLRTPPGSSIAVGGGLGVIFSSVLLLAGLILLAIQREKKHFSQTSFPDDDNQGSQRVFITEQPGSDCKTELEALYQKNRHTRETIKEKSRDTTAYSHGRHQHGGQTQTKWSSSQSESASEQMCGQFTYQTRMGNNSSAYQKIWETRRAILLHLQKKLHTFQAPGMELGDYPPHVYADEGDAGTNFELDAISIPGIPLDPDLVFDDRFRSLAAICGRNGNTANGVRSSPVLQQPQSQHWCEFGRDK